MFTISCKEGRTCFGGPKRRNIPPKEGHLVTLTAIVNLIEFTGLLYILALQGLGTRNLRKFIKVSGHILFTCMVNQITTGIVIKLESTHYLKMKNRLLHGSCVLAN